MRTVIAALALASALALTACTSGGSAGTATGSPPGSASSAPSAPTPTISPTPTALTPVVPDPLTEAAAATESVRLADVIQALIPAAAIVHVDDHTQLVDKGSGSSPYFGIIRTVTTSPTTDATATATGMAASLVSSGWISRTVSANAGTTLNALVSSTDSATAWFVIVGADTKEAKAPVITLQLASPNLP